MEKWEVFLRSLNSHLIASPLLCSCIRLSLSSLEAMLCRWGYLAWDARRTGFRFISASS